MRGTVKSIVAPCFLTRESLGHITLVKKLSDWTLYHSALYKIVATESHLSDSANQP